MIGFGTIFIASTVAFALVAQGFYKPQPLFAKARFADEILGGLLGIVQAGAHPRRGDRHPRLVLPDPGHRRGPRGAARPARDLWNALETSAIVDVFQTTLIPAFFSIFGLFIPDSIEVWFPSQPA